MRSERDARCIPPVASPSFFLHCLPIVFLPALPTQQNHYATVRGLGCNPNNGRMEGWGSETRVSGRPSPHASSTHRKLNHTTTRVPSCSTSILRRTNAQARPHFPDDSTPSHTAYPGRLLFFQDVDLVHYRGPSPFTSAHPSNFQLGQFLYYVGRLLSRTPRVSPAWTKRTFRRALLYKPPRRPSANCPPPETQAITTTPITPSTEINIMNTGMCPLQPDPPENTRLDLEYGLD